MKTILSLVLSLIIISSCYSQNREPAQRPFRIGTNNNYYISADSSDFKTTKFSWGFIWSQDYRMNKKKEGCLTGNPQVKFN